MASAELSRRVKKVVGYAPLSEMSDLQRREFHEALLDVDSFEDLPGKWQAAILKQRRTGPTCRSSTPTRAYGIRAAALPSHKRSTGGAQCGVSG
jgi:hypothetical protein